MIGGTFGRNLASSLTPSGDLVDQDGQLVSKGPDPQLLLHGKSFKAGYYLLQLWVKSPTSRDRAKVYFDDGTGFNEANAPGLVTKEEKSVHRIVHLPEPVRGVRLDPGECPGRYEVPVFRLVRVPGVVARRKMRKRLRDYHPALRGKGAQDVATAIRVLLEAHEVSEEQALRFLYEETFPRSAKSSDYRRWMATVEAPILQGLSERVARAAPTGPKISVLVPVYDPDLSHLRACLDSVSTQSYENWELCLANDASTDPRVASLLDEYAEGDERIRVVHRSENGHISAASNSAFGLATGEFCALLDHDDALAEHALLRVADAISLKPEARFFYSDEDKLSPEGARRGPHFKSRLNPELLLSHNYITHLMVARVDDVKAVGAFRVGFDGSQDHDLALRLTERLLPEQVEHIAHILYHWREATGSTATSASSKSYTAAAGKRAVEEALKRQNQDADVEHAPDMPNA
jgi:hypothetical protein